MGKLDDLRALREASWTSGKIERAVERVGIERSASPSTKMAAGNLAATGVGRRGKGRPLDSQLHESLTATQPWKAMGMSRRTWYRRQAEAKRKP